MPYPQSTGTVRRSDANGDAGVRCIQSNMANNRANSAGKLRRGFVPFCADQPPEGLLRGSVAAASLRLISSVGQLGGVVGPFAVGVLNDRTGNLAAAFSFIATSFALTTIAVWFACTGIPKEPSRLAASSPRPETTSAA